MECSFKKCPDNALTEIIDENENGGTSMVAQTVFCKFWNAAFIWCKWSHIKKHQQLKGIVGTCKTRFSKAKEENDLS